MYEMETKDEKDLYLKRIIYVIFKHADHEKKVQY